MKPFLILQLRPNKAGDFEYQAFLAYGGLKAEEARRIEMTREGVPSDINLDDYSGVIVGGGGPCVSAKDKPAEQIRFEKELAPLMDQIVEKDFPYLGACYGLGYLVDHQRGLVSKDPAYAEDVEALDITLTEEGKHDDILKDVSDVFRAFAGHKESSIELPKGMVRLASSKRCPNHMVRLKKNIYGTQFHPELDVENMVVRVQVYKNDGYFPPEDAQKVIDAARAETVTEPMKILKNFIQKYRQD